MNCHGLLHCCFHIVFTRCFAEQDVYRKCPARNQEDRDAANKEIIIRFAEKTLDSTLTRKNKSTKLSYPPKNFENLSAFRVADVTISLKSRRRATTFFNIPNRTSVFSDLSCASSMTITLQKRETVFSTASNILKLSEVW